MLPQIPAGLHRKTFLTLSDRPVIADKSKESLKINERATQSRLDVAWKIGARLLSRKNEAVEEYRIAPHFMMTMKVNPVVDPKPHPLDLYPPDGWRLFQLLCSVITE